MLKRDQCPQYYLTAKKTLNEEQSLFMGDLVSITISVRLKKKLIRATSCFTYWRAQVNQRQNFRAINISIKQFKEPRKYFLLLYLKTFFCSVGNKYMNTAQNIVETYEDLVGPAYVIDMN